MTANQQNGNGEAGTSLAIVRNKILNLVAQYADSISKLAPRGMLPEYYVEELRLYLSQPDKNGGPSKLFDCEPGSIARGILRVAQTGLSLGVSCDLLPFGKACQFNPRYTGIIELAIQSGARAINADVVYDDDLLFEYQKGTEFFLKHQRGPRKGKITHFYAIAELKPGSYVFEVMTRDEVEKFKKQFSKQWANVPIEECIWYGKKTTIRQISKFLPKNPRFAAALQFDREEPEEEEIPEGSYEEVLGDSPESLIASTVAQIEERPADGVCSEAQRERILDLIEHPSILPDNRKRIEDKLRKGLAWNTAKLWIDELERAVGTPAEAVA